MADCPACPHRAVVRTPPGFTPHDPARTLYGMNELAVDPHAETSDEALAKAVPSHDRIMTAGSRAEAALPPVHEDATLIAADWLQRIRERRDAGDLEGARASLRLFRNTHRSARIPDDLRALAQ